MFRLKHNESKTDGMKPDERCQTCHWDEAVLYAKESYSSGPVIEPSQIVPLIARRLGTGKIKLERSAFHRELLLVPGEHAPLEVRYVLEAEAGKNRRRSGAAHPGSADRDNFAVFGAQLLGAGR